MIQSRMPGMVYATCPVAMCALVAEPAGTTVPARTGCRGSW
jgi:hypothetical protein